MTAALRRTPDIAELRMHAAFIFAASDARVAIAHLEASIKLDPSLAQRDDVKELQKRLQGKK